LHSKGDVPEIVDAYPAHEKCDDARAVIGRESVVHSGDSLKGDAVGDKDRISRSRLIVVPPEGH
jgi:hypothetical protein